MRIDEIAAHRVNMGLLHCKFGHIQQIALLSTLSLNLSLLSLVCDTVSITLMPDTENC